MKVGQFFFFSIIFSFCYCQLFPKSVAARLTQVAIFGYILMMMMYRLLDCRLFVVRHLSLINGHHSENPTHHRLGIFSLLKLFQVVNRIHGRCACTDDILFETRKKKLCRNYFINFSQTFSILLF